ncbi:hypothetical protein EBA29_00333 [Bacillus velezensis]|nr:hypothetical protein EBA29_00333 [Bacillus velezensis]
MFSRVSITSSYKLLLSWSKNKAESAGCKAVKIYFSAAIQLNICKTIRTNQLYSLKIRSESVFCRFPIQK